MAVTTTGARHGHFEIRFWHRVFEEEVARVKGGFGPCNTWVSALLCSLLCMFDCLHKRCWSHVVQDRGSPAIKGLFDWRRGRLREGAPVRLLSYPLPSLPSFFSLWGGADLLSRVALTTTSSPPSRLEPRWSLKTREKEKEECDVTWMNSRKQIRYLELDGGRRTVQGG
jgi:hypothetical protein